MFTFILLGETLTFISIRAGKPREANFAWHDTSYDVIGHGSWGLWLWNLQKRRENERRDGVQSSVPFFLFSRLHQLPVQARVNVLSIDLWWGGHEITWPQITDIKIYYLHFVGTHWWLDESSSDSFIIFPQTSQLWNDCKISCTWVAWHDRVTWPCR